MGKFIALQYWENKFIGGGGTLQKSILDGSGETKKTVKKKKDWKIIPQHGDKPYLSIKCLSRLA